MDEILSAISLLADPVAIALPLVFLLLMKVNRHSRRASISGAVLCLGIWVCGVRPVAEKMALILEKKNVSPSVERLREMGVSQVVVLTGGGYEKRPEQLVSVFPQGSLTRFSAAMELAARLGPDCRIIFSGSAGRSDRARAVAQTMQELAQLISPGREVVSESQSGSTAEHANNVRPLLKSGTFALVTSAYHMPRSVHSFRRAALDPIPYPVDTLVHGNYRWKDVFPSSDALRTSSIVLREFLAHGLYRLKGW